jgi:hypothetical protein
MSKYKDIYWRTIGLYFVKQVVRMSSGFLQMTIWRLERSTTSKTEKEIMHVVRAGNVRAPAPDRGRRKLRMIVLKKINKIK